MKHLRIVQDGQLVEQPPGLAPTQAHVYNRAAKVGLTLEEALGRVRRIITDGEDDAAALVAVRTYLDYAGFKPATNARTLNMHVSGKSDAFFDKATFEKPPAPRIED